MIQPAPPDGLGLNPSLQNPYMMAHPPMLYLGYVGLTIPFAFAMAALVSKRLDERWIVATRRWTLAAWTFLGIGILLGAKWAYEEVGWGGWYAWDPVENAALMPWLVSTAFLHSVMVQEKKNMLRIWNVILVALAFGLSLFGTFLTRSGVINSIHSFSQSSIGAWFLGFICLVAVFSIALIWVRLPALRSRTKLESLVSREATFLYNNLFFVAFALTVLWGVAYPLVSEAVRGVASTVGAPYYNFFAIAFGLPLVLLMGLGPLIAWRRASLKALGASVAWPAAAALVCGIALAAAGAGSSAAGLVGYTFAAFVLGAIVLEFVRGTRARKALGDSDLARRIFVARRTQPQAVRRLCRPCGDRPSRRRRRRDRRLPHDPGAPPGTRREHGRSAATRSATSGRRRPRQRTPKRSGRGSPFPGATGRSGSSRPGRTGTSPRTRRRTRSASAPSWWRAEDLFVIAEQFNADGTVDFKVLVNPLVNLIWLAGIVFLFGSLIAMWPDAREQRLLARRLASLGGTGSRAAQPGSADA